MSCNSANAEISQWPSSVQLRADTSLLHAVVSMSLSKAGSPLAVLSNSTAYAYQPGMRTWMCVVDSDFALSSYASILASGAPGESAEPQLKPNDVRFAEGPIRPCHESDNSSSAQLLSTRVAHK